MALDGEDRHERLTIIEFVWEIESGLQPVVFASRELLH
jgi:hypothetical protein